MSRFWKILLWITGVLASIGILLGMIGAALGGNEQIRQFWMNRNEHIVLTNPGSLTVRPEGAENMELAAADEVEDIVMEIGGCDITIEETDDAFYGIRTDDNTLGYERNGGVLKICARKEHDKKKSSMTLYIPKESVINSVAIEIGGGMLKAENLRAEDSVSIEAGAGQFVLNGVAAKELDVELGAGRAELLSADVEDMELSVGAGEMIYQGTIRGSVEAECAMGALSMKLDGRKEDFRYEADGIGTVRVDGQELTEAYGKHEDHKENGARDGSDHKMELTCMAGTIEITFENGGMEHE
ncbi:MAG: DUF4097 family beta strand repeat protein [Lachnospiraceae bacterium]|nr:DUF4097 family beta strand repeat protein [Lachnospiraceae bacterium]